MSLIKSQQNQIFKIKERDIIKELLADKRSLNTRRAYERDLKDFFYSISGAEPSPQLLKEFLTLDRFTAIGLVLQYKGELIEKKLAEATVNRRIATIKSLVRYAQKIGKCEWSLEEVQGEKVKSYRDTSGITIEEFRCLLATCNRDTARGKRDYAILHLLWSNALRRNELVQAKIEDFQDNALWILGKGKGSQKERVHLAPHTIAAINDWLKALPRALESPLFCALDNAHYLHGLTGDAVYDVVSGAAKQSGITRRISPHRIRHSGITHALDATGGDVRKVQKLSRHSKIETLLIYDDNRINAQAEITDLLASELNEGRGKREDGRS